MKKLVIYIIALCCFSSAFSQNMINRIDTGVIRGAHYKIIFPAKWKGKLVMYAHGYEFMGTNPRQSVNPGFEKQMAPFLERGFAVAASDYSVQGYAFPQGVRETEQLRQYFVKKYGKPDTAFIAGHSMGGGITLATIENYGSNYNGGLPLCPLSSRPYIQIRKEFDLLASFNALFPGLMPSLSEIFTPGNSDNKVPVSIPRAMAKAASLLKAIVKTDSVAGAEFSKRYNLKLSDLPFALLFGENVLRDIAVKANGNPFDNTNTLYSGFPDDLLMNRKIERLAATTEPEAVFGEFDRTGDIEIPVLLMHTVYDQLIPPVYGEVNYENMVAKHGKMKYLSVLFTNGQGHCAFTPEQTGKAFDELRAWAGTGRKAVAGYVK